MSKPGPKPLPIAVLHARGSTRGKASAASEVKVDPTAPDCPPPAWLDDLGREAWLYLVPLLATARVVGKLDLFALARYCHLYSRWRRNEAAIAHGEVMVMRGDPIVGPDGTTTPGAVKYAQARPEVATAAQLAGQLAKLEAEFGMTPSSRVRITPTSAAPVDKGRFFPTELKIAK